MAQAVKNPPAMQETQETWVRFPGLERSPGEGNGHLLQCSCLGKKKYTHTHTHTHTHMAFAQNFRRQSSSLKI